MEVLQNMLGLAREHKLLVVVSFILTVLTIAASRLLSIRYDPREPPIISHPIPLIGHIIGMFRHGAHYFDIVNTKHNYPIYTLPTLNSRTYIIASPHLASLIQRSSKNTSFYSAILEVTRRLCSFDKPSMDIFMQNADREDGNEGLMPESHDMMASILGPGPQLNDMSRLQLEIFSETLGRIHPKQGEEVEFLEWLKEQFTLANTRAMYGPENLFDMHPELVKDFWTFEKGIMGLLPNILPSIFARKVYLARQRIFDGLVEYVDKERWKKASTLIQKREVINLKHGVSPKDVAHGELIVLFAVLGNAVPTTFWLLVHLYSNPQLLEEVRSEIEEAIELDGKRRIIHVERLKTVAPVLTSCFRETLRMVANLTSVRWIVKDTMLADRYLLKKDSMVQVASGVVHMDEKIWGPDAGEFNSRRFTTAPDSETDKGSAVPLPKNVPSAAFRAFGGGSVICPGRYFAQSEIVGFAAAVVMGFDFQRPDGGVVEVPERENGVIPLGVMKPRGECRVVMTRRKELEDVRWELEL